MRKDHNYYVDIIIIVCAISSHAAIYNSGWCITIYMCYSYSRTSNKGPSEKGTLYVKPLYRGL